MEQISDAERILRARQEHNRRIANELDNELRYQGFKSLDGPRTILSQMKFDELLPAEQPQAKPGTIIVNGIAVPEPMREAPIFGEHYYVPATRAGTENPVFSNVWTNNPFDLRRLNNGLCHLTEDAARAHFEALIAPSRADAQQAEQVTDEDAAKIIRASQAMDEMEDRYERRLMRFELTKAAMQGLLTHFGTDAPSAVATRSAEYADAALAELERTK